MSWMHTALGQRSSEEDRAQRGPELGKRTLTQSLPVQRKAAAGASTTANPVTSEREREPTAAGEDPFAMHLVSGAPLPQPIQRKMESSFATSFESVRVSEGGAAEAMGAEAMASGEQIQFAPGRMDFSSRGGIELLGHELAHVVQQREGRVSVPQGKGGAVNADAALEAEADAAGARAADGLAVSGTSTAGPAAAHGALQLKKKKKPDGPIEVSNPFDALETLDIWLEGIVEGEAPIDQAQVIDKIHDAPFEERQEVIGDGDLRQRLVARMGTTRASPVFSALLEGSQEWENPPENDFVAYFVTDGKSGELPSTSSMNCWESIIYAAYLAGLVDADWIRAFYHTCTSASDITQEFWNQLGFGLGLPQYPATKPTAGQLLFYHSSGAGADHVAVALNEDEAMSLWSEPNDIHQMQRIAITDLNGTVYIGDPPW
jgi:Domain of unknown function (DUF4157)